MIVYQIEHPDYGWLTYPTIEEVLDEIRNEIEANNLFPDTLTLEIKMVEMSQAEIDALQEIEI